MLWTAFIVASALISNFERLGWIRSTDEEFDIYWASVHNVRPLFNPENAVKRLKVVNHYPNHYELTRKAMQIFVSPAER
ncbi:Ttll1 [Symbiodinium microadriaticum]|nr:Ttll1 [Symbiodinium microadriaticum]